MKTDDHDVASIHSLILNVIYRVKWQNRLQDSEELLIRTCVTNLYLVIIFDLAEFLMWKVHVYNNLVKKKKRNIYTWWCLSVAHINAWFYTQDLKFSIRLVIFTFYWHHIGAPICFIRGLGFFFFLTWSRLPQCKLTEHSNYWFYDKIFFWGKLIYCFQ